MIAWGNSPLNDDEYIIQGGRFYARAWFSHRAAIARISFGDPQAVIDVAVPFGGSHEVRRDMAMQKAKDMAGGVIIALGLQRPADPANLADAPYRRPHRRALVDHE